MPEDRLDILIRTLADKHGAEEVSKALNQVKEEAKKAGTESKTLAGGLDEVKKSQTAAAEATQKTFVKTRDLRGAFAQLGREIPIVGSLARVALNPIALAVAAVAGGFRLWTQRVRELTEAMGGIERDVGLPPVVDIAARTESFHSLAEALRQVSDQYNSVEAAAGRRVENLKTELDHFKQLLEAQKNLDMARADSPEARAAIAAAFGAATEGAVNATEKNIVAEKFAEAFNVRQRGEAALRDAGGPVPSSAAEAKLAEEMDKRVADAETQLKQGRSRLGDIATGESLGQYDPRRLYYDNLLRQRYGHGLTYDPMREIENQRIGGAIQTFDEARTFRANREDWARRRGLRESGTADVANAARMEQEARDADAAMRRGQGVRGMVGALGAAAGSGSSFAGTITDAAAGADALMGGAAATPRQAQAINLLARLLGMSNQNTSTVIRVLSTLNDNQANFTAALQQVEQRVARHGSRAQSLSDAPR